MSQSYAHSLDKESNKYCHASCVSVCLCVHGTQGCAGLAKEYVGVCFRVANYMYRSETNVYKKWLAIFSCLYTVYETSASSRLA